MCIIRLLAEDESRADRAHRRVDLALLDAVTWPEFVWDWLRLVGARERIASSPSAASAAAYSNSAAMACRINFVC